MKLKKYEIHPGDIGTSLGYPHRVEANEPGFPVLRTGPISSYPMFPAKANPNILMSLNCFEGDSGGPVYIADPNREVDGKKQPVKMILGLVTGQMFLDEEVKLVYHTSKTAPSTGIGHRRSGELDSGNHRSVAEDAVVPSRKSSAASRHCPTINHELWNNRPAKTFG